MPNYSLVNPFIRGGLKTDYDASQPLDAAKKAWMTLSANFRKELPSFYFTLKDKGNNKLYHFVARERVKEGKNGKEVDYTLSEFDVKSDESKLSRFNSNLSRIQSGGKRDNDKEGKKKDFFEDDDDDEDDSDSSEGSPIDLLHPRTKIVYWWYDPVVYQVDRVYMPNFTWPLNPAIEVLLL
jgi:hypothetical protein